MANVVVIEDDMRLRAQIEALLLELNQDHKVRFFSTSPEFEQVYFKQASSQQNLRGVEPFSLLNDAQFQWFEGKPLANKPFSLGSPKSARPLKDLIQILAPGVAEPFTDAWDELVQNSHKHLENNGSKPPSGRWFVGINSPKGPVWAVEFFFAVQNANLTLSFKDWTPDLKIYQNSMAQSDDSSELRLFSSIDLIIARSSCLDPVKTIPLWVDDCFKHLRTLSYFPEDDRTRFILLKFEDDSISKLDLLCPLIDDLIYLPLDRPLFLQKLDIILGLPGSVTPKFLFNQKAEIEIEISKMAQVESLSEVGLKISNPVPLIRGLAAHFYLNLPNSSAPLSLYGKVSHSHPHPDHPHQHLIEFQFIALKQAELMSLRLFLKNQEKYRNLIQEDPEQFRFNPDNIFLEDKDRRTKQVVVIEVKDSQRQQAQDAFTQDMDNVEVLSSSSYYLFLKRYLEDYNPEGQTSPALETDLYAPEISFILQAEEKSLSGLDPAPQDEDMILGYPARDVLGSHEGFKRLLKDAVTETLFNEALDVALHGQSIEKGLLLSDSDGQLKELRLTFTPSDNLESIGLRISLPAKDQSEQKTTSKELKGIDLLIINQAFLPQDLAAWYTGFQDAAKAKGLVAPHKNIPIIVTADESRARPLDPFLSAPIDRLIYISAESRVLMTAAAELMGHEFTRYKKENIHWQNVRLNVHIAKKTWLEQMSEFGASIRQPRPIQPGTFLYLRGSIFENAPNQNLCARFYRTEDHPSEAGQFLCHLLYYGINDSFLKFARNWFRETYAASKQKGA